MLEAYSQLHFLECEDAKATGDRRLLAGVGSRSPSLVYIQRAFRAFREGYAVSGFGVGLKIKSPAYVTVNSGNTEK